MEKNEKNTKKSKRKIIYISVLAIIFIIILSVTLILECTDKAGYNMIKNIKKNIYIQANAEEFINGTVFLGDSLIEFYDLDKFYPEQGYINRGISGDTTVGLLSRFTSNVLPLKPSKIILQIGTNDLNKDDNIEAVFERYVELLDLINYELPNTKVIVQSLYPVNIELNIISKILVKNRTNENIKHMNLLIKSECEKRGIPFADINPLLVDENGNLKKELTADGLHVNEEGYKIITEVLKNFIDETN